MVGTLFIGAALMEACGAAKLVGMTPRFEAKCTYGSADRFLPRNTTKMALRRTLTRALARQIRPTTARGQRLWGVRWPQCSINARPDLRLDSAGNGTLTRPYSKPSSSSIMSSQDLAAAGQADRETARADSNEQEEVEEEEEEEGPPVVETWHEAVDAVLEATRAAFPSSPGYDAASPGEFQTYWRGVFKRLHQQVTSDARISEHLTSPPCTKFWVNVFAQGADDEGYSCPCCLPDVEPSVRLENPAGVTKGDLVAGLGAFLYGGDGPPRVHVEDADEEGVMPEKEEQGKRTGVLVHKADWMSEGGGGDDGKTYVYGGGWIDRPAMIWMYCCQPGEFAEKAKKAVENLQKEGDGKKESEMMAKL